MEQYLLAIITVLLTALIGFVVRFLQRLNNLEKKVAETDFRVTPMWAKVQRQISEDLHHPHPRFKEMDSLLEKLDAGYIDDYPEDKERLKELLIERSQDMGHEITPSQRASAAIMATVMEKAEAEGLVEGELVKIEKVGESPATES